MITSEIKQLQPQEKIVLINEIWETLSGDDIHSPSWHNDVLNKRIKQVKNNNAEIIGIKYLKNNT